MVLPILILFPVYLLLFLLDVAIFFLLVRLLTHVFPASALLFLDHLGEEGVDITTDTVVRQVRRWWDRPLSRHQEEALALLILSAGRGVLGVVVALLGSGHQG